MPELLKDFLLALLATLFVEQAPAIAKAILQAAARALPASISDNELQAWLAELESVEGDLSKLGFALMVLANVPHIANENASTASLARINFALQGILVVTFLMFTTATIFKTGSYPQVTHEFLSLWWQPYVLLLTSSSIIGLIFLWKLCDISKVRTLSDIRKLPRQDRLAFVFIVFETANLIMMWPFVDLVNQDSQILLKGPGSLFSIFVFSMMACGKFTMFPFIIKKNGYEIMFTEKHKLR